MTPPLRLLLRYCFLPLGAVLGAEAADQPVAPWLDLSQATVVVPPGSDAVELKAAAVLREEIGQRTGLKLAQSENLSVPSGGAIVLALESQVSAFGGPLAAQLASQRVPGAEGYVLVAGAGESRNVTIVARQPRGLLYGVGLLLRKMDWRSGQVRLPAGLQVATSPQLRLRGHQLGYRPKTNAYDAWSVAQYDQYIRELALFGANSIEILPPRTDDERTGPLMKVPPLEMMEQLSRIIDSYGLDVWIWYPNMGKDYVHEPALKAELKEREEVFRRLKRIDHILVPGGDPGDLTPDVYFRWMGRMAPVLARYHPQAKLWVSPQAFQPTREWLDSFYRHVNAKPAWLGGITFAPWEKTPLPELRSIIDPSIPIRNYPDITHNLECQYPVPNWDLAFALTLHRECYNPRPLAMKTIQNLFARYTCGSLTYSEGINDDVNKFVWSGQDWDASTPVVDTLRDYCRLFIGPDHCDDLAQGLLALERNWQGPLAANREVDVTWQQWNHLAELEPAATQGSFRFQMNLLRADYDEYIRRRLLHETELEAEATAVLRTAAQMGAVPAIDQADGILGRAISQPVDLADKRTIEHLADLLFAEIGSQLTIKRHGAQSRTRGAFLEGIDEPLNNVAWLRSQFRAVRAEPDESKRLALVEAVLHRTDPGPGGFYDSFGETGSEGRIINTVKWADDPGTLASPRITFYYLPALPADREIPLAWKKQARSVYESPLHIAYDNLDPHATYSIRGTYSGRTSKMMRLVANDRYVVAERIESHHPPVQEFPIPSEATRSGHLDLVWTCGPGQPGCEVAEVWLIKHPGDPESH